MHCDCPPGLSALAVPVSGARDVEDYVMSAEHPRSTVDVGSDDKI